MHAVLFDFDFTLADSSKGLLECVSYALRSSGLAVPEGNMILSTTGTSLHDMFSMLAPGSPPEQLTKLFVERADEVMVDSTRIYDAVPDLLTSLKSREYKVGIVSTKFRYRIEAILEREKIRDFFDIIVGGEDVIRYKPDPEGLEKAICGLRCGKELVTYVGDSVVDAKTAASAGIKFIGVSTGTTTKDELLKHGALFVVEELIRLMDVL